MLGATTKPGGRLYPHPQTPCQSGMSPARISLCLEVIWERAGWRGAARHGPSHAGSCSEEVRLRMVEPWATIRDLLAGMAPLQGEDWYLPGWELWTPRTQVSPASRLLQAQFWGGCLWLGLCSRHLGAVNPSWRSNRN